MGSSRTPRQQRKSSTKTRAAQQKAAEEGLAANPGLSKAQGKVLAKAASEAVAATQATAAAQRPSAAQAGEQKHAYSRLQVAHLRFATARAGLQDLTLLNAHMHHSAAKKAQLGVCVN